MAAHLRNSVAVFVAVSVAVTVVLLLAFPAAGKFSRASSAGGRLYLQSKCSKSDRVGRRGLSEPREDFPRLSQCAVGFCGSAFAGSVFAGSAIFTGFGASARGVKASCDILIAASATNWATSAASPASIFST